MKALLMTLLLLAGCSGSINQAVSYFNVETPKPFGYVIGDEIPQRIIIESEPGVQLQTASLPAKGPINRWLNLNKVSIKKNGQQYEIELLYQVFYAPFEVKMLTIPGFNLLLTKGEQQLSQTVPDWSFTLAPLRELAVRKSENGEYMRPDAKPSLLSDTPARYGLYAGLALALIISGYLGYLYGYFPNLMRHTVFKRAQRKVERLSKNDMEKALTIVHQAFNSLYQQPLFRSRLSHFFQLNPQYQQMNAELDWFINYSNRFFFSSGMIVVQHDLDKLKDLCRQCRAIERGSR